MADKTSTLIAFLGGVMADISIANGYNNDVVEVTYGVTTYNANNFASAKYPRIHIIANQISIPDFSTKVNSQTEVNIKIDAYLRKGNDLETSLETYQASLGWSQDIRRALTTYFKTEPNSIDSDLKDNRIEQEIGFPMTLLTCSTEFGVIFEEDLIS